MMIKKIYHHHSLADKLRAVSLYAQGLSSSQVGIRLGINSGLIRKWAIRYRALGIAGFKTPPFTRSYPVEFKVSVVRTVKEKSLSFAQTALQYGISESSVNFWVQKVKASGYDSLLGINFGKLPPQTMGRPKKQKPQTELEILRERVERLEAENALLKKVKALVEQQDAQLLALGRKPSKN